jgi:microcystin-dependent protein
MAANRIQLGLIVDTLVEISAGKFASAPVVGASVTIKKRTGAGAVEVYEQETGEVATVPTTDGNGRINGWVNEGAYTITVTGGTPYIAATEYAWDALSGRGIENGRIGVESIWRSDLRKDENPNDATSVLEALVPTGTILAFGGASAPAGFLLCDGKEYAEATYNRLFKVIGYTFGKPSAGKFNVPNTLGRVIVGAGAGAGLTARTLGEKGGTETVVLSTNQLAKHGHSGSSSTSDMATNGGGAIIFEPPPGWGGWLGHITEGGGLGGNMNVAGYPGGGIASSVSIGETGSNEAHPNIQPFLSVNGIIKT